MRENILALGSAQVVTWLVTTVTLFLLPRYLGPAEFGRLSLAASFATLAAGTAGLGFSTLIAREVARGGRTASETVLAALAAGLGASLLAVAVVVLALPFLGYNGHTELLIVLALLGVPLTSVGVVAMAVLQGLQVMRYQAALDVLGKLLFLGAVLLVILAGQGAALYSAITLVVGIGTTATLSWFAWSAFKPNLVRPRGYAVRGVIVKGLPLYSNELLLIFYMTTEVMLLSALADEHQVGIYSAALRLFATALFIPNVLAVAIFPRLSLAHARGHRDFADLSYHTICLLFLTMVPMAIGLATVSTEVTHVLFGRSFLDGGLVTAVLALTIVPTSINVFIARAYVAGDRQLWWTMIMAASLAAKVAFGLVLIRVFDAAAGRPALGAAVSLVSIEFLMAAAAVVLAPPVLRARLLRARQLAAVALGLGSLAVLVGLYALGPLLAGSVAMVFFAGSMAAAGVLPRSPAGIRFAVGRMLRASEAGESA